MRIAIVSLFLAVAGSASASFELVLALDYNNHKVHRIDGENSVYLGSFGANRLLAPSGMALQQSANRVHVYDTGLQAVISFNYNTGEKVAEVAAPAYSYAQFALANNGDFLIGDYYTATARRYSQAGTLLATFVAPAGSTGARAMMQAPDGAFYVAWNGSNVISRHNSAGTLLGTAVASTAIINNSRQMFVQNNQVVISGGFTGKWMKAGYSATGAWGALTEQGTGTNCYGTSGGHFSTIYTSSTNTTGDTVLNSYHLTTAALTSTFIVPGADTMVALATVIAPEPSSLAAVLLVGGLAMLRRRRRAA